MHRDPQPARHTAHRPRRPWWKPWRQVCACGLYRWPCPVPRMAVAGPPVNERPAWNGPTRRNLSPAAPLLTRGQAARSRREAGHRSASGGRR